MSSKNSQFFSSAKSVFSFDIFDTLLLRPYIDPQELWRVIEEEEGAAGFAKDRKSADAITYKRAIERGGETSFDEAYLLIPKWSHLKQKELDKERCVLQVNPEMQNLWNELGRQGKRRVIVSDMYLPSDFLQSVLREKGIDGWDAFYLSSDRNVRKASGDLFRLMLKEEGVSASDVCHIGDNMHSDVDVPSSLGIKAVHYQKISDRFFCLCPFARYVDHKLAGSLALGWHEFVCNHERPTYWHRLGFVMGGVLGHLYVSWIVQTAKREGIDHLMFVGRDGYAWQKICNDLYPDISTDYFFAPRIMSIATLGATGHDPNAIRDRQEYLDTHLQGVDRDNVRDAYREYLDQFIFDEHTAIVDGCSSGFSAQRMVEDALEHRVFTFYLMTMAPMHYGACLYHSEPHSQPFQALSEFLFGAPTPPVFWISKDNITPVKDLSVEEKFKMSVSDELVEGIVAGAHQLHLDRVLISPDEWVEYCDEFMRHLTSEDLRELKNAKNAVDVQQKNFWGITYQAIQKEVITKQMFGHPIFTLRYHFENGLFCYVRLLFSRWTIGQGAVRWYDVKQIVK